MTSGPGDSRRLGGTPTFGERSAPAQRASAVMPPGARPQDAATVASPDGVKRRPVTVGTAAAARPKGRRAKLTVKRIDPWTTLKFAFVYGLAGTVVLLVTVIVLYGVVDAMGVIDSIRSFLGDVSSSGNSTGGLGAWLGFDRVLLVALVVGAINVVLFTAFATLTAFIYNVCTDIVGGIEVTLAERD
ncbi:MAG TPA: DUF3566 domain-containing protein [Mycobacteriales bacterium]|nr:DUF3566 domain-containing protein [Mycobacteriales bacterium]